MSLLETENLHKTFGDLVAVDSVDLAVEAGTVHSVIGPNGAGKSTLFDLVTGLHEPTGGRVRFDGEDITGWSPYRIARRGVARSFQTSDVFGGLEVGENVRIAAQAADDRRDSPFSRVGGLGDVAERARSVLTDVGLAEYRNSPARDLGHGDRRKLEIALTVVNDPTLLLLDEPTAGVGKGDAIEMIEMIRRVAAEREVTIVMIEHDIEMVMNTSDTVTVLQNGRVIAEGPPEAVSDDAEVQRAYLGVTG